MYTGKLYVGPVPTYCAAVCPTFQRLSKNWRAGYLFVANVHIDLGFLRLFVYK